jgi:hypothetical protein
LVVGVREKKAELVAKRNEIKGWTLYRNIGNPTHLKKADLRTISHVSTLDEVLARFDTVGLVPCCRKSESDAAHAPSQNGRPAPRKDKRRFFRKQVTLNGEYRNRRSGFSGAMLVKDVSFRGVRFITLGPHSIEPEQPLQVFFTLDNDRKSQITRTAKPKHIEGNMVGAEFVHPPEYDKELGLYLS